MCHELTAHTAAIKDFLASNPEEMILKSGAIFSKNQESIIVKYFARNFTVSLSNGEVTAENQQPVSPKDATLILQYLTQCNGLPPRGTWISFLELPQGIHHYVPFLKDACQPISNILSDDPNLFMQRAASLGGRPIKMGDAAALIPAFPKLPLAVAIWQGDDEFPAKANILFDSIAPHHLTTAALWVLGCEMARKMTDF
ncbi:DUF3786 domain-containing protein [Desulfallas thermosapovorans]|uniref:Uncharacterized protein DUF3786 n=1 Tax=Desulfallas thermosapovorans DSM 6562 TaxID=1121431 RepID=A0A5S4ZZP9_9FIRM|nr:DUF3786 domain-containing protein [Desulfallas thermosapovorans]TYO97750.1 uncharacterized protein DUF3786 [Desulfallas thermosapovorans DSM 6562]